MNRSMNRLVAAALVALLGGCGSGGAVQSTPTPTPTPAPTPTPSPTPTPTPSPTPSPTNFNTAEYRRSSGPFYHGAITAYEAGASGAGVTVGIVDSGIADVDDEFTGRISPLSKDFAGNANFTDVSGHGTAIAEALAGARNNQHVLGMAWGATILALRTDDPGSCATTDANGNPGCTHSTSAIAQAVDYGSSNGARVINISLGGNEAATSDLLGAISRATARGTIIVIAAGNADGSNPPLATPDAFAESLADPAYSHGLVLIATSVNNDDTVSSFSNGAQGYETVSMAALGNEVLTIGSDGKDYLYTGTSLSAPQISGAIALLAQAFPSLTSAQIVGLLKQTARDVGGPGPDAHYGVGILDVAAAFEPQGTLSLAGSAVAVGNDMTVSLSPAMGDVTGQAFTTVIQDAYGRPYAMQFAAAVRDHGISDVLTPALTTSVQNVHGGGGGVAMAFAISPGRDGAAGLVPLTLSARDASGARLLSGMVAARLSSSTSMALGIRTGLAGLAAQFDQQAAPAFLVAGGADGAIMAEQQTGTSLMLRRRLTRDLAISGGMENGELRGERALPDLSNIQFADAAQYQAVALALQYDRHWLGLTGGLRLLDEQGSALGARFAPFFGAQSARSLFARVGLHLRPAPGLSLSGEWQRGWTNAAAGGALTQGGLLVSQRWSAQLVGQGVLDREDLLGLRVAMPLRVIRSRFDLALPASYDWRTGLAQLSDATLDLVPRGRELDAELSYSRPAGGGWLGANLFLRRQPGNIAAAPDDAGVALRWSVGF